MSDQKKEENDNENANEEQDDVIDEVAEDDIIVEDIIGDEAQNNQEEEEEEAKPDGKEAKTTSSKTIHVAARLRVGMPWEDPTSCLEIEDDCVCFLIFVCVYLVIHIPKNVCVITSDWFKNIKAIISRE